MTQTTRLTVLQKIAPAIGGYQGSITSGAAGHAILGGLVGALNDDELNDDLLVMPDAANDSDQTRVIADWGGPAGRATWDGNRSDVTYTSETYFTIPRNTFTLQECRQAVSRAVTGTKRTYRYIVPTRRARTFPLSDLTWLRNADDVDGVFYRGCPGMLANEEMEHWHDGTTSAPDGWTLSGAGATVARSTTFASFGPYLVQLTSAAADANLTQDVPYQLAKQLIDDLATVAVKVRVTATVASEGRVGINDGNDTTWSSYHSGDGEPEDLTASRVLTADASRIRVILETATGTNVVSFDRAALVEGSSVDDGYWETGAGGFLNEEVEFDPLNTGSGVPVLSTRRQYDRGGQFVVVTRRPYADLTADSASTEAPEDTIVAKTIFELAVLDKPAMTRDRADRLLALYGTTFAKLARGLVDKPVERAQTTILVRGA